MVDDAALDAAVARTDGVTASFLKELLRRAALLAGERLPSVDAADLDAALDELLDTRNAMTRVLLGGRGTPAAFGGHASFGAHAVIGGPATFGLAGAPPTDPTGDEADDVAD